MSTRRKPGDVVWKRSGAGFSGTAGLGVIPVGSEPEPCLMGCGDPDCQEWPDLWAIGAGGSATGENWCHVSECEMLDRPNAKLTGSQRDDHE